MFLLYTVLYVVPRSSLRALSFMTAASVSVCLSHAYPRPPAPGPQVVPVLSQSVVHRGMAAEVAVNSVRIPLDKKRTTVGFGSGLG